MKRSITLLLFALYATQVLGQNYPVRSTTMLQQPAPMSLSGYVSPGTHHLELQLYLKDFSQSNYPVRLRLVIQGPGVTLRSDPNWRPRALYLTPGVVQILRAEDLAPYFDPNHLVFTGLSKSQYYKTKRLPEGFYKIGFEVVDDLRGNLVSHPSIGMAMAVLRMQDPPFLNLPNDRSTVRPLLPQNLIFNWSPRHAVKGNTKYEFTLIEVIPQGNNPNAAFQSSKRPLYRTETTIPSLQYGMTEPPLEIGHRYAWRVRVLSDSSEGLFKNKGYSEVYSFVYGSPCPSVQNVQVAAEYPCIATFSWDPSPGQSKYKVRIHNINKAGATWHDYETHTNSKKIRALSLGATYEYEVISYCDKIEGEVIVKGEFTSAQDWPDTEPTGQIQSPRASVV